MSKKEQNFKMEQDIRETEFGQQGAERVQAENAEREALSEIEFGRLLDQADEEKDVETKQTQESGKDGTFIRHGDEEIVINLKSLKGKASEYKEKISQNKEKIRQKSDGTLSSWKGKLHAKRKKLIMSAIVIAFAIMAAGYVVKHTGYRGTLNGIVSIINDREGDVDVIAKEILPADIAKCYEEAIDIIGGESHVEDALKTLETKVDSQYAKLDDYFGSNAKISLKVLEKEKMSQSQIRRAQNSYQEYYEEYWEEIVSGIDEFDYDKIGHLAEEYDLRTSDVLALREDIDSIADYLQNMEIAKGYNLTLGIEIKGSKDSYSEKIELRVIKVNGEWVVDYLSFDTTERMLWNFGSRMDGLLWFL